MHISEIGVKYELGLPLRSENRISASITIPIPRKRGCPLTILHDVRAVNLFASPELSLLF
jgi:hypothetical protein